MHKILMFPLSLLLFFVCGTIFAEDIMIDKVDFEDAELKKAISFLSSKCSGKANIFLNAAGTTEAPKLTMSFREIPLNDLIRYICMQTGMKYKKSDSSFIIGKDIDELYITQYSVTIVPPTAKLENIKAFLESYGVTFPEGSTINYSKKANTLTVKNTEYNHDIILNLLAGGGRMDVSKPLPAGKNFDFIFSDIQDRLRKIKVSADFRNESAQTVLQYIEMKTREKDPSGKGINIFFCTYPMSKTPNITLSLTNMPVGDALKYIASAMGMNCKIEDHAVVISPKIKVQQ